MNAGHQIFLTCSLLFLSCTSLIAQFYNIQWDWDSTEVEKEVKVGD